MSRTENVVWSRRAHHGRLARNRGCVCETHGATVVLTGRSVTAPSHKLLNGTLTELHDKICSATSPPPPPHTHSQKKSREARRAA